MTRITVQRRDAIVEDTKVLLRRHGISPYSLRKFAEIAQQEMAADRAARIALAQAGRAE